MPFYIFSFGSGLLVLGFTLFVVLSTNSLTRVKNSQGKAKIFLIGVSTAAAGLIIVFMSLKKTSNERATMMTTGGNIIALGMTTLIQIGNNPRTQKVLRYVTWGTIGLGFFLCILYEMFGD
ncbi:MAG TPA: hypothetical protein VEI27_00585 [Dehalococcoidales bacterium]|nr:hypothetical protein [Dehalococcoidales bacterium]